MKRLSFPRWRILGSALTLLLPFAVGAQPRPASLLLIQRSALPPARTIATDIRWAGADSVYVSWDGDGVAEIGLDGARRRTLVPDLKTLGKLKHYSQLAVSPSTLAVASVNWSIAWRPLKPGTGGEILFRHQEVPHTMDFDLHGDKVLLLGIAKREGGYSPHGDLGWLGVLGDHLSGLQPVFQDAAGPGAPHFQNCGSYDIGAARFLADGSFVVAPGFQDGVHLFAATGRRTRTWTNEELGIDSHLGCAGMTEADEARLRVDVPFYEKRLNGRRHVDDILPLPQGPGLLIRSWGDDQRAHWTLKVLQPTGILTYEVPVAGRRPFDRLHGDVRDGKIVLLLSGSGFSVSSQAADRSAELLVLKLPDA